MAGISCFLVLVTLAQKGKNMGLSIVFQVVYRICRKDHSTGWSLQSSCDIVPELQQKNFHLSLWALWQPSSYNPSPNLAQRIYHNQRVSWMPFWFNRVDYSYRKSPQFDTLFLPVVFVGKDPTPFCDKRQFFWDLGKLWKLHAKSFFPCSLWGIFLPCFHVFFFLLCEVFCMIMSWIKVNCLLSFHSSFLLHLQNFYTQPM